MGKPAVLFLCTGNSARSQMAEAILRKYAGESFEVYSAGLRPVGINPLTIEVMEEAGINLDGHTSKPLSEFLGKVPMRYVMMVCEQAEQQCPSIWPFDDPAASEGTHEERLQTFRNVRDQIEERILSWLAGVARSSHGVGATNAE